MRNEQVILMLKEEENELARMISKAEKEILKAPEGSVQIRKHKNGYQFFLRRSKEEKNGIYIPKADKKKAEQLVQKRYLQKLLAIAGKQKQAISDFLQIYDPAALAKVYCKEGELRQKMLQPFMLPDPEYAEKWMEVQYEAKPFHDDMPAQFTKKGEKVRSKSEAMIANELAARKIPYRYECPLHLGSRTIYPDFTILRMKDRKIIYWEHLGLMDDSEYRNHAFQRIRDYEHNGIFPGDRMILTVETARMPLNTRDISRMIDRYVLLK